MSTPATHDPASDQTVRSQLTGILILTEVFFVGFLGRVALAPILPAVEADLGLTHALAGSLFFWISLGYCVMLFLSGLVSARLEHRSVVILSCLLASAALVFLALSRSSSAMSLSLTMVGLATGLYLPSGIAIVTHLTRSQDWGKALAVHELAPALAAVLAPFLGEAALRTVGWRGLIWLLAVAAALSAALVWRMGRGGNFRGQPPTWANVKHLIRQRVFWTMVGIFTLGISAAFGVYTMTTVFLEFGRGFERGNANALVGMARTSALWMPFLTGLATDRLGPRLTLAVVFLGSGGLTVLLGAAGGNWVIPVLFLQTMLAVSFFPAGFAALSRIAGPEGRSLVVGLGVPLGMLMGGGVVPAFIGYFGDLDRFGLGFGLLGLLILCGAILGLSLRFPAQPSRQSHL